MIRTIATFARAARRYLVVHESLPPCLARDVVVAEIFTQAFQRLVASDAKRTIVEGDPAQHIRSILGELPLFMEHGKQPLMKAWDRASLIDDVVKATCREPLLLGWFYIFWNEQERDASTWAISREEKPRGLSSTEVTATQLFTEEYMAHFIAERCLSLLSKK